MIKILEVQHQLSEIWNRQSRIIEVESFESYLKNLEDLDSNDSLPRIDVEVGMKHIDYDNQSVIFMFEHNTFIDHTWVEFVHFAQVIN